MPAMNAFPLIFLIIAVSLVVSVLVGYWIGRMEKKSPPPPPVSAPPPPSLLRLFLDAEGKPNLELDGALLHPPLTAEQRKRLIAHLNLIRPWIESSGQGAPSGAGPVASSARPAATPPPAAVASPRVPAPTSHPPSPPKEKAPAEAAAPLSIIAQVDQILQELLKNVQFPQVVRLLEGPDGGIQVVVGLKLYRSVEEVPDPQIQQLIRQAVMEWEKRR
jgi:hypothetical protein